MSTMEATNTTNLEDIDKERVTHQLLKHRRITQDTNCWEWTGAVEQPPRAGYGLVCIRYKRKQTLVKAHRLAACVYHKMPLKSKAVVRHVCDNPPCFNPDHLIVGTHIENIHDMVVKGRDGFTGEKNGRALLLPEDVRDIRSLRSKGVSQRKLASFYEVHRSTIKRIDNGQGWKHIA